MNEDFKSLHVFGKRQSATDINTHLFCTKICNGISAHSENVEQTPKLNTHSYVDLLMNRNKRFTTLRRYVGKSCGISNKNLK